MRQVSLTLSIASLLLVSCIVYYILQPNNTMASVPVCDGVSKEILREGNGAQVKKGDTITVHCTGSMAGNPPKKFWSTKDAGQKAFTFQCGVGQVIAGWDQGCLTMRQGEVGKLTVRGDKGYGERGFPAWGITPNATLIFEIEILTIS